MTTETNQELLALRRQHVPRGVGTAHPIFAARAEGARLWDVEGNEYIDFTSGISVTNVGHNHPAVIAAMHRQLDAAVHTCFQVAMYEPYVRLAERLNSLAPGATPKKTIFFTTGAEAVENAVKIARAYTDRPAVISFTGSFHGRTLLGMSLTGKALPYKQNFGPYAPEVYHVPYPYAYRGWTAEASLAALRDLFLTQIAPSSVAAVVIEPVLGEGGFVPAPIPFLRELRRLTEEHGILFIDDEIQSGLGRTGTMFSIERAGIEPDIITVAKSLAGGLPLSGVIGRAEVMDAPAPGGLGGTFAGNPVACAGALAVLDLIEEDGLLERAGAIGSILAQRFQDWRQRFAPIGDVRATGPMAAIELVRDRESREPAPAEVAAIVAAARERGLLLLTAGIANNVIRTLVPLTISDSLLNAGLDILEGCLEQASGVPAEPAGVSAH